MANSFIFSSESVNEGHPDKVADTISDHILDLCLEQDPASRVACETMVKDNLVILGGEITTNSDFNYQTAIHQAIKNIGYTYDDCAFHADTFIFLNALGQQSNDIAQGVDEGQFDGKDTAEQGAGDQGLMFGYACDETPSLMPAPITYAHQLGQRITELRKSKQIDWLRPDSKTQVSCRYQDNQIKEITAVVISTQHADGIAHATIKEAMIEEVIKKTLPANLITQATEFLINPTGKFVIGGPVGDCGLTGRKIIVDTYGGMGRHGGGAFSGKDPSKVDRSAAYMCRWVAKHIVAAGLAAKCEIQVAYAIGHPKPVSISVEAFGTATVAESKIEQAIKEVFSFKPADIIQQLDLLRPIYSRTTNYGHFGREDADLPWENLTRLDALKAACA